MELFCLDGGGRSGVTKASNLANEGGAEVKGELSVKAEGSGNKSSTGTAFVTSCVVPPVNCGVCRFRRSGITGGVSISSLLRESAESVLPIDDSANDVDWGSISALRELPGCEGGLLAALDVPLFLEEMESRSSKSESPDFLVGLSIMSAADCCEELLVKNAMSRDVSSFVLSRELGMRLDPGGDSGLEESWSVFGSVLENSSPPKLVLS